MPTDTMHPLPSRRAVLMEEVRAVGLANWRLAALGGLALVGFAAMLVLTWRALEPHDAARFHFDFDPRLGVPFAMVALVAPFAVWWREDPERRDYLWSMPLERSFLNRAKSGAGWAWLMGAVAVYLLWAWITASLFPGSAIGEYRFIDVAFFRDAPVGVDPRVMRPREPGTGLSAVVPVPAWQWLVPFVAATLTYLAGSIVAVASSHPIRWAVVAWMATMGVAAASEAEGLGAVQAAAAAVLGGRHGLEVLLSGIGWLPVTMSSATGETLVHRLPVADLRGWLGAVLLWGVPVVVGYLMATRRHREA